MNAEIFWRDVKFGLRGLVRNRAFAVVALVTLGLGIGANAAVFSVVNAVLLRPLPYPDSKRIALVWKTEPRRNLARGVTAPAEYLDWKERNRSFEQLAGWVAGFYNLAGAAEPEQVWGARITANFFDVFQVKPAMGRGFLPEEEQPGHDQVAMLSYRFWQEHFGGDRGALGRSITVDDKPFTIVGVLPQDFSLWGNAGWQYDVWMPFAIDRSRLDRDQHLFIVFGRLKRGVSLEQANAEMRTLVEQIKKENPGIDPESGVRVAQMHEERTRNLRPALEILLGAAGIVLLIACVNMANLLLSRATGREREMAVRASLGAGRRRLLVQLLTESVLLAMLGGAFGVLLAAGALRLLPLFLPAVGSLYEIPYARAIRIDAEVLLFAMAISALTGVLFGLAPALQISQTELSEALKEGGRGGSGGRRGLRLRGLLVVAEMAVSLLLLTGAGLLARSFLNVMSERLGYDPKNLLTMQIRLPGYRYQDPAQFRNFFQQVNERVRALPGVRAAGMINALPLTGWSAYSNFEIDGKAPRARGEEFTAEYRVMDSGYLAAMGMPVLKGRGLEATDAGQSQGVALINAALAARFFPGEDPVGKQIRLVEEGRAPYAPVLRDSWLVIAGVVGDTTQMEFGEAKTPILYLSYLQNPSPLMRLVVRTEGDAMSLATAVRRAVATVDKDQPVSEIRTMDELVSAVASRRRMNMALVAFFAVLATALAGVGIYGVMSYSVTQQTHDLGIRMALGAQPQDVLRLVVRQGMRLALTGIALGMAGAIFLLRRVLSAMLYGLSGTDPMVLAGTAALLAVVAFAACYLPARRATRVDPLSAIRYE
jgi:putative ABC transport system permease protein